MVILLLLIFQYWIWVVLERIGCLVLYWNNIYIICFLLIMCFKVLIFLVDNYWKWLKLYKKGIKGYISFMGLKQRSKKLKMGFNLFLLKWLMGLRLIQIGIILGLLQIFWWEVGMILKMLLMLFISLEMLKFLVNSEQVLGQDWRI